MRLPVHNALVASSDLSSARQFQIKASAHAFKLLVDQYRFPIRATVRETVTNAVDIHIRTNQQALIEVTLPTLLNNYTFTVRDYGTGLSEEKIYAYYATFFSSDKNNTDAETGGLGLGCKCPLTYTDQFTVESRQNGTLTAYSIFVAADGIPSVLRQDSIDYVGPDGLTVHIPVRVEDIHEFTKELRSVIAYAGVERFAKIFDEFPPRNAWFEYEDPTGVTVRFIQSALQGVSLVVMGGVAYTAELGELSYEIKRYVEEFATEIVAPIGHFEIHPSRESLIFRKSTIAELERLYTAAINMLKRELNAKLATYPTLKEAIDFLKPQVKGLRYLSRVSNMSAVQWLGIQLKGIMFPETLAIMSARLDSWRRKNKVSKNTLDGVIDFFAYDEFPKFVWRPGKTALEEVFTYLGSDKTTLIVTGPIEDAKYFVEEILGETLEVMQRRPRVSGTVKPKTRGPQARSYDCWDSQIQSITRSLTELQKFKDNGVVFIHGGRADATQLYSWRLNNIVTTTRPVFVVDVPETHTRVCKTLELRTLTQVLADSTVIKLNEQEIAKQLALRGVYFRDVLKSDIALPYLEQVDEEAAWYLQRRLAVQKWTKQAQTTSLPSSSIIADASWEAYALKVFNDAELSLKKHRLFISLVESRFGLQADTERQEITDWYKGARV